MLGAEGSIKTSLLQLLNMDTPDGSFVQLKFHSGRGGKRPLIFADDGGGPKALLKFQK